MAAVCRDAKECHFYFPKFEERSLFRSLAKAKKEVNQLIPAGRWSLDKSILHSQKSLRALSLNAHVKSFEWEAFNEKVPKTVQLLV